MARPTDPTKAKAHDLAAIAADVGRLRQYGFDVLADAVECQREAMLATGNGSVFGLALDLRSVVIALEAR